MRLMRFKFTICHVPGKHLNTADALSRAPLVEPVGDLQANDLWREIEVYVNAVLVCLPASDKHLDEFHRALKEDDTLQVVTYHVEHGWPNSRCEVSGPLVKYWTERGKLTLLEGLLFRGKQIVAPADLCEDVLRHLHDGHQGVTKTWANASSSVWWPGMSKDIEAAIRNCAVCEKRRRDKVEPMKGTEFPERPWARVGADFFYHKGTNYLVAVDYYSRDVEISRVPKAVDAKETIAQLKKMFAHQGIPDVLFTDNGPQFSAKEFADFAEEWKFTHITSSPRYPQSNGEAERIVQTMKNMLDKASDEHLALLAYRNTPLHNGFSPA